MSLIIVILMIISIIVNSTVHKPESIVQRRLRDHEYSIFSLQSNSNFNGGDDDKANNLAREREQLYEAYNLLHTLAQVSANCCKFV